MQTLVLESSPFGQGSPTVEHLFSFRQSALAARLQAKGRMTRLLAIPAGGPHHEHIATVFCDPLRAFLVAKHRVGELLRATRRRRVLLLDASQQGEVRAEEVRECVSAVSLDL
jgi:hypothetical protein